MRLIRTALITAVAALSIAATRADWTQTFAIGEGGSHVVGNPQAKVRLTEFVSYTCGHCAHFQKQADDELKLAYVQKGKVSVEVRHLVRDPVDLSVALLSNCGTARQFFGNHNMFLRSQERWIATAAKASKGQQARWTSGPLGARMKAVATDFGFYRMMEQRGYTRAALDRCLSDEARAERLAAQTQAAAEAGVEGTPSFMLNGTLLAGTHDWPSLKTQINARF